MELPNTTEFDELLGTVGAENNSPEICKIEKIVDNEACESIGLREGEMYLLGELLGVILESSPKFPSLPLIYLTLAPVV